MALLALVIFLGKTTQNKYRLRSLSPGLAAEHGSVIIIGLLVNTGANMLTQYMIDKSKIFGDI